MDNFDHQIIRTADGNFVIRESKLESPPPITTDSSMELDAEVETASLLERLQHITPEIILYTSWFWLEPDMKTKPSLLSLKNRILGEENSVETITPTEIRFVGPVIKLSEKVAPKIESSEESDDEDEASYNSFMAGLRIDPNVTSVVSVSKDGSTGQFEAVVHVKGTGNN